MASKTANLPEPMTLAELRALHPVMDLEEAAIGLRMTYPMARKLVSEGKFPLKPLPHSGRYRLYALADLLRYLGFDPDRLCALADLLAALGYPAAGSAAPADRGAA